jgi:hypothetical protein
MLVAHIYMSDILQQELRVEYYNYQYSYSIYESLI